MEQCLKKWCDKNLHRCSTPIKYKKQLNEHRVYSEFTNISCAWIHHDVYELKDGGFKIITDTTAKPVPIKKCKNLSEVLDFFVFYFQDGVWLPNKTGELLLSIIKDYQLSISDECTLVAHNYYKTGRFPVLVKCQNHAGLINAIKKSTVYEKNKMEHKRPHFFCPMCRVYSTKGCDCKPTLNLIVQISNEKNPEYFKNSGVSKKYRERVDSYFCPNCSVNNSKTHKCFCDLDDTIIATLIYLFNPSDKTHTDTMTAIFPQVQEAVVWVPPNGADFTNDSSSDDDSAQPEFATPCDKKKWSQDELDRLDFNENGLVKILFSHINNNLGQINDQSHVALWAFKKLTIHKEPERAATIEQFINAIRVEYFDRYNRSTYQCCRG